MQKGKQPGIKAPIWLSKLVVIAFPVLQFLAHIHKPAIFVCIHVQLPCAKNSVLHLIAHSRQSFMQTHHLGGGGSKMLIVHIILILYFWFAVCTPSNCNEWIRVMVREYWIYIGSVSSISSKWGGGGGATFKKVSLYELHQSKRALVLLWCNWDITSYFQG